MKISVSQLKSFKACRRAWWLKYVEGVEPVKKADALEIGTNYHAKLEALYNDEDIPQNEYTKESAMAWSYIRYIYPKIHIVKPEEWLEKELSSGDFLIGKIDGWDRDGCVVEHKTTSRDIGPEYEYNLQWDEQVLAYMYLTDRRLIHYTVCKKPTIRQKKNETDEEFYYRMLEWYEEDTDSKIRTFDVIRTDDEVNAWAAELIRMLPEIKGCQNCYKNTAHCMAFGRMCEYQSICLNYDPNQDYIDFQKRED